MLTVAATMFVGYFALLIGIQVIGFMSEFMQQGRFKKASRTPGPNNCYDWRNVETYKSRMARKRY